MATDRVRRLWVRVRDVEQRAVHAAFGASHDMFGVPNLRSEGTYTWLSGSTDPLVTPPLVFQGGLLGSASSVQPVSAGGGFVHFT